jgi:hypothetical protein
MALSDRLGAIERDMQIAFFENVFPGSSVSYEQMANIPGLSLSVVRLEDIRERKNLVASLQSSAKSLGKELSGSSIDRMLESYVLELKSQYREEIDKYHTNPIIQRCIHNGVSLNQAAYALPFRERIKAMSELTSYSLPVFSYGSGLFIAGLGSGLFYGIHNIHQAGLISDKMFLAASLTTAAVAGIFATSMMAIGYVTNHHNTGLVDRAIALSYHR